MHLNAHIEALRSDPASQRRSSERMASALAEWHATEAIVQVRKNLDAYSQHGVLHAGTALARLVSDCSSGAGFIGTLTGHLADGLRDAPLGEVPFRHSSGEGFSRLLLLRAGGAALSLCAYAPRDCQGEVETVQFADFESHEIVIAGEARGTFYRREAERIVEHEMSWSAGDRIIRKPDAEARHVLSVQRSLLVLQLTRTPERPGPSREFRLSDGALLRLTSGDKRASEQVMALAVLGALGAQASVGPIGAFARDPANDRDARWEAVRQLLALDAGAGFDLLCEFARYPNDTLAAPSRSLRDQLAHSHPVLRQRIEEPA